MERRLGRHRQFHLGDPLSIRAHLIARRFQIRIGGRSGLSYSASLPGSRNREHPRQ